MTQPNRLAHEGEVLVVHRFPIGSMGLASPTDVKILAARRSTPKPGFWSRVKTFLIPPNFDPIPAVCIPPGARLRLDEIPPVLQNELHAGPTEEVTFTQLSELANTYRDAIRFPNGLEVRLQHLIPGHRVVVLDLGEAGPEFLDQLRVERAETAAFAEFRRG
jgi:hypothetical protein